MFNGAAATNDVNFAYILNNKDPSGIFTSIVSVLQTYNDDANNDNLNFYIIDPASNERLDFTGLRERISKLVQSSQKFNTWQLVGVPSLSKLTGFNYDANNENLKYFLSHLLDSFEVQRIIFLSENTLVVSNLRFLWTKSKDISDQCIISVNGDYSTESTTLQRYVIGCMVANLALMKTHQFLVKILEIRDKHPTMAFDEAFYQYKNEVMGNTKPNLNIRYDALVPSLPSKKQFLSFVDDDPETTTLIDEKIEEFSKLTVMNYGTGANPYDYDAKGVKQKDDAAVPNEWPYQKWSIRKYHEYYITVQPLTYLEPEAVEEIPLPEESVDTDEPVTPGGDGGSQSPDEPVTPGGGGGSQSPEEPVTPGGDGGSQSPEEPDTPGGDGGSQSPEEPVTPGGGGGSQSPEEPVTPGGDGGSQSPDEPDTPGGDGGSQSPEDPDTPGGDGGSQSPDEPDTPEGDGGSQSPDESVANPLFLGKFRINLHLGFSQPKYYSGSLPRSSLH
ncbi:MAG: hypothetical protein LBF65_00885 [Holosporales bacterium]|nr:hypothetical protein [Holosporales bacterium]